MSPPTPSIQDDDFIMIDHQKCKGKCGQVLPVAHFIVYEYFRSSRCNYCRSQARDKRLEQEIKKLENDFINDIE